MSNVRRICKYCIYFKPVKNGYGVCKNDDVVDKIVSANIVYFSEQYGCRYFKKYSPVRM